MPQAIYVDPYLFLALMLAAAIGFERLLIDVVRFVDKRTRPRKKPDPPSPILKP